MPIAAQPSAWISSRLTAPDLVTQSWNHTTGFHNPHNNATTTTTDSSIPVTTPNYPGPPVESPAYITIFIAVGSMITMVAGITALFHSLLRRNSSSPSQLGYEGQEEEEDSQSEDENEEGNVERILCKAAHLRSPMERLIIDNWSKQRAPFQL